MSRLIVVTDPDNAKSVIRWAARLGEDRAEKAIVLSCFHGPEIPPRKVTETRKTALLVAVDDVLRELQAFDVEHFELHSRNLTAAVLQEIEKYSAEVLVVGVDGTLPPDSVSSRLGDKLLRHAPCTVLLLDPGDTDGSSCREILIPIDSAPEAWALKRAVPIAESWQCDLVPLLVRRGSEEESEEIAERELEFELRQADVRPAPNIKPAISLAPNKLAGVLKRGAYSGLVFVGATSYKTLRNLRVARPGATLEPIPRHVAVGVFRRDVVRRSRWVRLLLGWVPELKPEDRVELFESLQRGARWNADFVVMIAISTAIASLGLLQNSVAVVIGAMLVAPLMTPMIGAGLALIQRNLQMFHRSTQAMSYGIVTALAVSLFFGLVTPGLDLTPEILARGAPNVLDLGVAFLSGCAAAYAMARPNILGAMAGVAIAAALVPPLASVGLAASNLHFSVAAGALLLFTTNLVAIVLGSSVVFKVLGVRRTSGFGRALWVRVITGVLVVCSLTLIVPLWATMTAELRQGQTRPYYLPVTFELEQAVKDRVAEVPGLQLVRIVRMGLRREADASVVLTSDRPVSRELKEELKQLVKDTMRQQHATVRVFVYRSAWED